jgi:hypothetical protein
MDLPVYRIFHPATAQQTFLLATRGTFSKIDHILGHKASLSKYKIELTPCILSDHNAIHLELNKKATAKTTQLNRTFSKEEIQMAKKHMEKCSPSLAKRICKSKQN